MKGGKRFELKISSDVFKELEDFKAKSASATIAEALRRAIHIASVLSQEIDGGKRLILEDRTTGNQKEVLM